MNLKGVSNVIIKIKEDTKEAMEQIEKHKRHITRLTDQAETNHRIVNLLQQLNNQIFVSVLAEKNTAEICLNVPSNEQEETFDLITKTLEQVCLFKFRIYTGEDAKGYVEKEDKKEEEWNTVIVIYIQVIEKE